MAINITLENYEGPFDLLLNLIRKNEMNVYNVNLSQIAKQYIDYLKKMKELDLEIASEFVVIATTLLEIKSKKLLPKSEENEVVDEVAITEEELLNKLVEYNKYKEVAKVLRERESVDLGHVYSKMPEIIDDIEEVDLTQLLKKINLIDLYNLYAKLLNLYYDKHNIDDVPKQIYVDIYKIEDKMKYLKSRFFNRNSIVFSQIMYECENKLEIIVTFLALLELIKLNQLKVVQESNYSEIYMEGGI